MKRKKKQLSADLGYNHNRDEQPSNTRSPKKELPISWNRQERGKKSNPKLLKAKRSLMASLKKRGYFQC